MKIITYLSNLLMASFIAYTFWIIYSFLYSWLVLNYPNSPLGLNLGAAIHPTSSAPLPPNIYTMKAPLIWKIVYSLETILIFGLYLFFAGFLSFPLIF